MANGNIKAHSKIFDKGKLYLEIIHAVDIPKNNDTIPTPNNNIRVLSIYKPNFVEIKCFHIEKLKSNEDKIIEKIGHNKTKIMNNDKIIHLFSK